METTRFNRLMFPSLPSSTAGDGGELSGGEGAFAHIGWGRIFVVKGYSALAERKVPENPFSTNSLIINWIKKSHKILWNFMSCACVKFNSVSMVPGERSKNIGNSKFQISKKAEIYEISSWGFIRILVYEPLGFKAVLLVTGGAFAAKKSLFLNY